jgi:hypothetical protein
MSAYTTKKLQQTSDVRILTEAELHQVSGGYLHGEEYWAFFGLFGLAMSTTTSGTLNKGLHR